MNTIKRMMKIYGLAIATILIFVSSSFANDNKFTRVSLAGIEGFYLKTKVSSMLSQAGVKKDEIQNNVIEKLKAEGIQILDETTRSQTPGRPMLETKIVGSRLSKPKIIIYDINILVYQDVALKRDPNTIVSAVTWSKKVSGKSASHEDINKLTQIALDMFLKSYKSVNPK